MIVSTTVGDDSTLVADKANGGVDWRAVDIIRSDVVIDDVSIGEVCMLSDSFQKIMRSVAPPSESRLHN